MEKVDYPDKKIGDAKKKKVVVLEETARIPRHDEDTEGHDNTEQFDEAMKKQKAMEAGQKDDGEDQGPDKEPIIILKKRQGFRPHVHPHAFAKSTLVIHAHGSTP